MAKSKRMRNRKNKFAHKLNSLSQMSMYHSDADLARKLISSIQKQRDQVKLILKTLDWWNKQSKHKHIGLMTVQTDEYCIVFEDDNVKQVLLYWVYKKRVLNHLIQDLGSQLSMAQHKYNLLIKETTENE